MIDFQLMDTWYLLIPWRISSVGDYERQFGSENVKTIHWCLIHLNVEWMQTMRLLLESGNKRVFAELFWVTALWNFNFPARYETQSDE